MYRPLYTGPLHLRVIYILTRHPLQRSTQNTLTHTCAHAHTRIHTPRRDRQREKKKQGSERKDKMAVTHCKNCRRDYCDSRLANAFTRVSTPKCRTEQGAANGDTCTRNVCTKQIKKKQARLSFNAHECLCSGVRMSFVFSSFETVQSRLCSCPRAILRGLRSR